MNDAATTGDGKSLGSSEVFSDSPREIVETLASNKIKGFLGTIGDDGQYLNRFAESLAGQTTNVATDYRDRFLVELIQNAYDAQPIGVSDGRIEVTLDMGASEHGTLYVANTGQPFAKDNVESLSYVALSAKSVGQSIGNKGLGFRSVVQISDEPRIFSQLPEVVDPQAFHGFCFRFASSDDFDTLIESPSHRQLAKKDLPKFHIPIWLDDPCDLVRDFARHGLSTVIELPLRDHFATDVARRKIDELEAQEVPMHLFLDRISELSICVVSNAGDLEKSFSFTRTEQKQKLSGLTFSHVSLGANGEYFIARRELCEKQMKATIAEAIALNELDKYWNEWTGPGDVAVAVRLDAPINKSRIYTYLPMGDQAEAPFSGYLQGSFFPSSNRKNLDAQHRLNALILDEARALVADAIWHLVGVSGSNRPGSLTDAEAAKVVAEMMSWRSVSSLQSASELGAAMAEALVSRLKCDSLDDANIVPCFEVVGGQNKLVWKTPALSRDWPSGLAVFGKVEAAKRAQETNSWPLWAMSEGLSARLNTFLNKECEMYLGEPSGKERARLVEVVAKSMLSGPSRSKKKWIAYFVELPVFMDKYGVSLAGLQVLIGDDGLLHRAMSHVSKTESGKKKKGRRRQKDIAIFSPPDERRISETADLEIDPPAKLQERFGFLWNELPWHEELSETRLFLEKNRLVEEFDREAIFNRLDRILRDEGNKEVLRGGLRWAFELWRQARSSPRPFRMQPQFRFRVPTQSGEYIDAREAIFSASWPEATLGALVQEFLDVAPQDLKDVQGIQHQLLAETKHPAFFDTRIDEWVAFLTELGVRRGLHPVRKTSSKTMFKAHELRDFSFVEHYGIPLTFGKFWCDDIESDDDNLLRLPTSTNYVIADVLLWFPCQGDLDGFTSACQRRYACLVLQWLETGQSFSSRVEIHHEHYRNVDSRLWPMPLTTFLRASPWIPTDGAPASDETGSAAVASEFWLNDINKELFLPFLPRPMLEIRRLIERGGTRLFENLRNLAGLNQIGSDDTLADQLVMLSSCYENGRFDPYYRQRLLNLYYSTWRLFLTSVSASSQETDQILRPPKVLVQRGHSIEVVNFDDDEETDPSVPVYICDTGRLGDVDLLMASGQLFFNLPDGDSEVTGKHFQALYGERIRRISKVEYSLQADGKDISEVKGEPINSLVPELRSMVAVAMEALRGTEAQRLPSNRAEVLRKLEQILLAQAEAIRFVIDGNSVGTDDLNRQSFSLTSEDGKTLIVLKNAGELNWDLIDRCLLQICESLGHVSLAAHLRILALARIGKQIGDEGEGVQARVSAMADTLRLSQVEVLAANSTLSEGLETRVPILRAVLHYAAGPDAIRHFDRQFAMNGKDPAVLRALWADLLKDAEIDLKLLDVAMRDAHTARDFREMLGLDFALFNHSLSAVGEAMELYPEQHRRTLEAFVRQNDLRITQCILYAEYTSLEMFQPFEGYNDRRAAIYEIMPDASWLPIYEVPPEKLIKDQLEAWLQRQGALSIDSDDLPASNLTQVREHNRRLFQTLFVKAVPIVRAWCAKRGSSDQAEHFSKLNSSDTLRKSLDRVGALDFKKLDEEMFVRWCKAVGAWPGGMDGTLELEALGLSANDLKFEAIEARKASENSKREARSVSFNGRSIDPEDDIDFEALAEEIGGSLSRSVLSSALSSQASLRLVEEDQTRPEGSKKNKKVKGSGQLPRIPPEKTEFIGRLGEIVAYSWLKTILKGQDIDAAWKSGNGGFITGRDGNDGLGYDFEVSYRKQTWRIEVKASLNDPKAFELGETEVAAAREAAKDRNGFQYKIAYVSYVADPSETRIEILPNPMTDDGASVLRLRGEGIRYSFERV
jgi:hypothetical protein|tara:strand:+ start:9831 stop:15380 length:5550 start_codon:yes stop_codon:yes gene_type:complete